MLSSDKKAKEYGTGGLYAVPGALSVLGVYYNKDLVSKAGISETPATLDEFEADLGEGQGRGDDAVQPRRATGWRLPALERPDQLARAMSAQYRDWVYGKSGSTIETDGAKQAAQKVTDWVKAGYVPKSANATADSDAQADFVNGKSAYLITGNWAASAIQKEMGDKVGFFLFPQKSADADKIASGASVAFSISSKTKHPNEAAAFLDFMSSPEAAKVQVDTGFMPVDTETAVETTRCARGHLRSVQERRRGQRHRAVPRLRRTGHDRQADRWRTGSPQRQDDSAGLPGLTAGVVDLIP